MEAAKIRFLRSLLGLTILDCQRKSNIHNRSTTGHRLPRLAVQYQPKGRDIGRPRWRWKD